MAKRHPLQNILAPLLLPLSVLYGTAGHWKRTRAKVRSLAEHRVSDVVVVRYLNTVKENAVFKLCGVADNAPLANDRRSAYKSAGTYLAKRAYYRRPLNYRPGIDSYSLADKHKIREPCVPRNSKSDKMCRILS